MKSVCESYLDMNRPRDRTEALGPCFRRGKTFPRSSFSSGFPFANLFPRISTWIFLVQLLAYFFHDSARFRWKSIEYGCSFSTVKNSMTSTRLLVFPSRNYSHIFGEHIEQFSIFLHQYYFICIYIYIIFDIVSKTLLCRILFKCDL